MTRARFLVVVAVVNALFSLGLLLAPGTLAVLYGSALDAAGTHVARISGTVLLGLAIVQWCAREAPASALLNGVLVAGLIASGLAAIVEIHSTATGLMTAWMGWLTVLLHLLFAAGFAKFLFAGR